MWPRLALLSIIIVSSILAWITAVRMRRRIKRALGKKVSDMELTSLNTWMEVDEAEEGKRGGKLSHRPK